MAADAGIHHASGLQCLVEIQRASTFALQCTLGEIEMIDGDVATAITPCCDTGFIQFLGYIKWQGAFDFQLVE